MTGIQLVPLERRHAEPTRRWMQDSDLRDRLGTVRPPSEFEHEAWMDRQASDPGRIVRIVEVDGEPTGACGLLDVDAINRNAEIWLYSGGDRRAGVGSFAVRQLLDYAFGTLGLHRIRARVFAFNEPALAFFRKHGFVAEGVERQAVFKRGEFHDVHVFGMLSAEFGKL